MKTIRGLLPRQRRLGRNAVKEAFDNLPGGVCFFSKSGVLILCNREMYRLAFALMGHDLQNMFELRRALDEPDRAGGVRCLDRAERVYLFPGGAMLRFAEAPVRTADGTPYIQFTSSDVTELMAREQELRDNNRNLEAVSREIAALRENARDTIREEQTLSMKIRIHDDLGACITAAHQCLTQGRTLAEIRRNRRLREEAVDALWTRQTGAQADALPDVIARAADLGVAVRVRGALPRGAGARAVVLHAVWECASNCARHARGTELTVELRSAEKATAAVFTNNGAPPEGGITEGGGLGTLRRRVERAGGTMRVESSPVFRLTVTLPEEEEEGEK